MNITRDILQRSFWALPIGEVLDILETTRGGLSADEVKERRHIFGRGDLPKKMRLSALKIFFGQFKSPLLLLLLGASGVTLFLKDWKDAGVILAAVAANIILGFYQENKAEASLSHLKTYIIERTRVFRDGHEIEEDAAELVPGDIIHLAQGDRVPADCRLIYLNDFVVDEAILTGESLPVNKTTEPSSFKAVLADRKSMVFNGTLVVQGFANAVVCATGKDTELGKIASFVAASEKETTPLQKAILRFSMKTSVILLALTLVVFFLGLYAGKPILDMFLIAVAIAVAAVPEGLPVALTVILAIGVQRLAKKNGIVRKLLAAETLGNTSIILTDKTGTLTEAKMELSKISVFASDYSEEEVIRLALLNTDVVVENVREHYSKWRLIGRPLEAAMVKAAARVGILINEVKKKVELLDYLPFTSKNKFSASLSKSESGLVMAVFGAPEILLKNSDLPETRKQELIKEVDKMAYSGERVLGLAIRTFSTDQEISLREKGNLEQLHFLGTISFRDPLRLGAKEAIQKVRQAGVRTLIVTGDHRGTAESVAEALGFHVDRDEVIDGAELDSLSDVELKKRLSILQIVARVSPEGKLRIAKAFKELGEVVAMTGDGINDAASLKEADIGIAMGSGTDVAKDVSDLVLLDDNFSTIVAAIEEGRRILENIRKVIVYLFSSLFGELILIGGAIIAGLDLPLTAIQILFVNFIADTFPALALAFEDHGEYLGHKRKKKGVNLFDKEMAFLTFLIGAPTSVIYFALYYYLVQLGFDIEMRGGAGIRIGGVGFKYAAPSENTGNGFFAADLDSRSHRYVSI
ncbi:MAG: Ca2+-transporting ATPase [Parcubacteria group bacterium Gr01-1014_19]|nr:MAG: Ca2+-transporting ATPase [Parcubacteria group bacterium Gr01-1014_19]